MSNRKISETLKSSLVESGVTFYYFGSLDSEPTSRLDGSALQQNDMYWDTNKKSLIIYDGEKWKFISGSNVILVDEDYTVTDANSKLVCKAGDITITLPENPMQGTIVPVLDGTGDSQDHPITVEPSGDDTIAGDDKLVCDTNNFIVYLTYIGTNWLPVNAVE